MLKRTVFPVVAATAVVFSMSAKAQDTLSVEISSAEVSNISQGLAKASTPEEAAKRFGRLATDAIGKAIADAAQTILARSSSLSANTSSIKGWEQIVIDNGIGVQMYWPTPELMSTSTLPARSYIGESLDVQPQGVTGSISITIGGNF